MLAEGGQLCLDEREVVRVEEVDAQLDGVHPLCHLPQVRQSRGDVREGERQEVRLLPHRILPQAQHVPNKSQERRRRPRPVHIPGRHVVLEAAALLVPPPPRLEHGDGVERRPRRVLLQVRGDVSDVPVQPYHRRRTALETQAGVLRLDQPAARRDDGSVGGGLQRLREGGRLQRAEGGPALALHELTDVAYAGSDKVVHVHKIVRQGGGHTTAQGLSSPHPSSL